MKQFPLGYLILPALLAVLFVSAVGGSELTSQPSVVVDELSGIRVALESLSDQVRTMRRSSDAELVLRQIQIYEQRVAPLEAQLASTERRYIDSQAFLASATERLAQAEQRIEETESEGRAIPEELQKERDLIAQACERDKTHQESLRSQIVRLENQVADGRDKVAILEERFAEMFED